jgi:dTDP-4-amino-4,6-dideoxygalactose transaminase
VTEHFQAGIAFTDLAAQRRRLGDRLDAAIKRVLDHGVFIMGPEVRQLEEQLAVYCGARHAISCSNGTDALALVLMAKGLSQGDAVLVPSFTFAATAEVVVWFDAIPIFVDVLPNTFNLDPASLKLGFLRAKKLGLNPRAVIPVDLFGQPAAHDEIATIAAENGAFVLTDAAQSFGANYKGRKVGTIGLATTTSFFPAKPLGCYGDGGAVFTDDDELASLIRSLRVHGQGTHKYDNTRIGLSARLDTLQAAILIEKLAIFADEIEARERVAQRYHAGLDESAVVPRVGAGSTSIWAQYTLRVGAARRNAIAAALKARGIPTAVYYPLPLHQQTAYRAFPTAGNGCPVSERLAMEVLSLPMHPYLGEEVQDRIIASTVELLTGSHVS